MQDTSGILGILDTVANRRTTATSGEVNMYREHVTQAAATIRTLEAELRKATDKAAPQRCDRQSWCAYGRGHKGDCSLIRPRNVEVSTLVLSVATDALIAADRHIDFSGEEQREAHRMIDRALGELSTAQGVPYARIYDDE